ncbi:TPA: DUF2384 domain-containing protein [Pseudomonas putida]|nr:DUF2384 domain-containing protein [Pseudomonas putida]
MFLTHPALDQSNLKISGDGATQAWNFVTRTSLTEWFYLTHTVDGEETIPEDLRMVQIDDGYVFQRFINRVWGNRTIGEIYLMSPVMTSDGSRFLTWRCELLLEMKRFSPVDDGRPRYAYQTEFGSRSSEPRDERWCNGEGELVYQHPDCERKSRLIRGRSADSDAHYAKQVINWACELFVGDLRAAAKWLHSPLVELGNRAPCDMASAEDNRLLEEVVSRLEQSKINEGGVHV